MNCGRSDLALSLHRSIHEIDCASWNGVAGTGNPFIDHRFLSALEDSGSVGGDSGWCPSHASLRDENGKLLGVAPLYIKTHSYGEYVFDSAWANALERAGGNYYPKLQVAVPFSPVSGPRLLTAQGVASVSFANILVELTKSLRCSSIHVTFCSGQEAQVLGRAGWFRRVGLQYHWHNRGYAEFDDFLAALVSRKRKMIRRERREAQSGLEIRLLRGMEIGAAEWQAFYEFYLATIDRKWGGVYLSQRFFPLLGRLLGDLVVLVMAFRRGKPIAGALNLLGDDALYGRNWGACEDVPFLHFELCYYQAIEFAIKVGLPRVEAGAQGRHKIQRGYLPAPTYSAHWIAHRGLAQAVASFIDAETPMIEQEMVVLGEESPYHAVVT